jgi:hypothetical protein
MIGTMWLLTHNMGVTSSNCISPFDLPIDSLPRQDRNQSGLSLHREAGIFLFAAAPEDNGHCACGSDAAPAAFHAYPARG